ncbi:hypothetical protein [Nocardioides sp. GY 10127]|uniref:hypothetical protein n=1 Tax=Nocardioides sp. GY 10127 TaxID=2569762 RepID=UPI0010A91BA2|nr:hypothetical protein [Nocardioides sp. GY 10127]TIC80706.1 hypothetical protein E8D37_12505 [Nocardioides sp. GY 10127]
MNGVAEALKPSGLLSSEESPEVEAVLMEGVEQFGAIWFGRLNAWEVIGVEVEPRANLATLDQRRLAMLKERLAYLADCLALGQVAPLTQSTWRSVPLAAAKQYRSDRRLMSLLDRPSGLTMAELESGRLTPSQRTQWHMLQDASDYTAARAVGVAPLELIAARRQIGQPAAMQRVNRARKAGLLAAEKSGGLTAEARALRAHLIELATGRRILGEA